jgi:hypothetical protein
MAMRNEMAIFDLTAEIATNIYCGSNVDLDRASGKASAIVRSAYEQADILAARYPLAKSKRNDELESTLAKMCCAIVLSKRGSVTEAMNEAVSLVKGALTFAANFSEPAVSA